ncbi:hypothetical protein HAX54_017442 [Datura stramonium]|uniref:Uncharacterized protein n=1 Tax=Datura stramonium TaxID=4076 RepID=A0ABS8UKR1_DATST|nr:hypothetical protein [Datura stramonium]
MRGSVSHWGFSSALSSVMDMILQDNVSAIRRIERKATSDDPGSIGEPASLGRNWADVFLLAPHGEALVSTDEMPVKDKSMAVEYSLSP